MSIGSMLGMLDYRRPVKVPMGVPRKIAMRRARNQAFKDKSLRRARWWRKPEASLAKHRLRRQRWEEAPYRLAYAVMIPLIRRYRQRQGLPVHKIHRVPDNDFDFWIEWLEWISSEAIPTAAAFRESSSIIEHEVGEPIQQLIRALSDFRDGVRSRYTEGFFSKKAPGRKPDIDAIAQYKAGIGTAYRVLSTIGMCSRREAIKVIQREMRRIGFIEIADDAIPEFGRKVSDTQYRDACKMEIFSRQELHPYVEILKKRPELWRRLAIEQIRQIRNPPKKRKMLRIWAMNRSVVVTLLLGGLSALRELERFHGYVQPNGKFSSLGASAPSPCFQKKDA